MIHKVLTLLAISALSCLMIGCQSDAELSKDQEKELRNNFNRALTPEEIARMNGGGAGKKATEGATRPERTQG